MTATAIQHGRWGRVLRRPSPDYRTVAAARAARRTALIAETVRRAEPSALTHAWVAEQTGVPVGYLTWRYPEVANLRASGL
jgi:DNA-binding transcriptional regulator YbjK